MPLVAIGLKLVGGTLVVAFAVVSDLRRALRRGPIGRAGQPGHHSPVPGPSICLTSHLARLPDPFRARCGPRGSRHWRQGSIIGAIGLLAFALVANFCLKSTGAIPALIVAALAWLVVSLTGYAAVMAWRAATEQRSQAAPDDTTGATSAASAPIK